MNALCVYESSGSESELEGDGKEISDKEKVREPSCKRRKDTCSSDGTFDLKLNYPSNDSSKRNSVGGTRSDYTPGIVREQDQTTNVAGRNVSVHRKFMKQASLGVYQRFTGPEVGYKRAVINPWKQSGQITYFSQVSNDTKSNTRHNIPKRGVQNFLPKNSTGTSNLCHEDIIPETSYMRKSAKTKPYVSKRECNQSNNEVELSTDTGLVSTFIGPMPHSLYTCSINTNLQENDTMNLAPFTTENVQVVNRAPRKVQLKFKGHTEGVNRIQWNPTKDNLLASCSMDHTVAIWDTYRNGACMGRFTFHGEAVKDISWSHCGTKILSCGYDKCARLVDIETGNQVQQFQHKDYVTCVKYHPVDPNIFLSGTFRIGIKSWDVRTAKVISQYQASFGQVQDVAFLPGGQEFISAAEVIRRNSTDKGIMAWDFKTTAVLSNQIYQEAFMCTCLKVHPSGSHFIAQSNGNYMAIFSTKRPYKLNKYKRYEGHQVSAYCIGCDFSPDGSLVISGSADGKVYVYSHGTSKLITTLTAHSAVCMDTSFHPSQCSTVASCCCDGNIVVWI